MAYIGVGSVLKERFELVAKIGEGGFARVFWAHDRQLKREVALKLAKNVVASDEQARFMREAKLLAQLSHENIISVLAYDSLDDFTPFIVMELLKGMTLRQFLSEREKLDYELTLSIFTQICKGLQFAHDAGVVHRDLSPSNIFLCGDLENPIVKLLDFGLAKLFYGDLIQGATLTVTGNLIGSPQYMSPELAKGDKVDGRGDIYAMGCILYESLCGKPAFSADTSLGLVYLQQNNYPPAPEFSWESEPGMTQLFKDIDLVCLQKDPSKRFGSCAELIETLSIGQMPGKRKGLAIDSWSRILNEKESFRFSRFAQFAVAGAIAVFLFVSILSLDVLSAQVNIVRLLPVIEASSEESFAKSLLENHKPALAKTLYAHLATDSSAGPDKLAIWRLGEAESMQQAGLKQQLLDFLPQVLLACNACQDKGKRIAILTQVGRLIEKPGPAVDHARVLQLQLDVLEQMLNMEPIDNVKSRQQFSTVVNDYWSSYWYLFQHNKFSEDAMKKLLSKFAKLSTRYVSDVSASLNGQESDKLNYLVANCQGNSLEAEAESLMNARIAASNRTGESAPMLTVCFAEKLMQAGKPEEAMKLAKSIREQNTDRIIKAKALNVEAQIYRGVIKDNPKALLSSREGLQLMAGLPMHDIPKYYLQILCITELNKQGDKIEVHKLTQELVTQIWSEWQKEKTIPLWEYAGPNGGLDAEAAQHDDRAETTEIAYQEILATVLSCLIETNQISICEKQLERFRSKLNNEKNFVADAMKPALARCNQEKVLQKVVSQIIEEDKLRRAKQ